MAASSCERGVSHRGLVLRALLSVWALSLSTCSVGHGSGTVSGTISIGGCRREAAYELRPSSFFAQAVENLLKIRIQRGSDMEVRSDGLAVLVEDATTVKRSYLGVPLSVGPETTPTIDVSLYLNESCPAERDKTPVVLSAVRGTVTFHAIYAPRVDKDEVRIAAELTQVRFEDPRTTERWAELSGELDFLYVRGSPAQVFP